MNRKIIFYSTVDRKCPVQDFLDALPAKVFQKVIWVLKLISELERIPSTYFKKITNTNDIWECRIVFGSNIYRMLCFFKSGSLIVLTNGFVKKTQKTPIDEIQRAEEYKIDYNRRVK